MKRSTIYTAYTADTFLRFAFWFLFGWGLICIGWKLITQDILPYTSILSNVLTVYMIVSVIAYLGFIDRVKYRVWDQLHCILGEPLIEWQYTDKEIWYYKRSNTTVVFEGASVPMWLPLYTFSDTYTGRQYRLTVLEVALFIRREFF